MPFAQWGFPHQGTEAFRDSFPADFISEAVDQTRGWFYSLLMISTLLFDDDTCREFGLEPVGFPRPFRNCIVLGLVSDVEGRKESKSKGNYTSPNLVLRGRTRLDVLPDASLERGQVGLKSDQVRALDLASHERVTLTAVEESAGDALPCEVVAADVRPKDTVHVHPEDLATLGLPEDGGSLWFRIPTDPPGADAFRWLFASANPPWSNTRLSMRAVRDAQREFLIRLRNVYQFFAIYANIARDQGNFDPVSGIAPSPAERSELDRWILHRLNETVGRVTELMDAYLLYDGARSILAFVDDLSNWYVRRSRSRFWGEGKALADALWTLYEVLQTLTRLIAPFVPFTADALYQELVRQASGGGAPPSVHLDAWPEADPARLDNVLGGDMALVRELASLGLAARASARIKVRQPLLLATVVLADPSRESVVLEHADVLKQELNVKRIEVAADADAFVSYLVKPDFRKLGPRLGKDVKRVAAALSTMDGGAVKQALDAGGLQVDLGDRVVSVDPTEVVVRVEQKGDYQAASSPTAVVALSTRIGDDLRAEGLVRELVNRVQGLRRDLDLGYTQRISLKVDGDPEVLDALGRFGAYLQQETLATELSLGAATSGGTGWTEREWDVDGHQVRAAMLPK
jgi:isoleucyl-tRNA synthetase